MRYAFYPGCSLDSTSVAYDLSVREVAKVLGTELVEVQDWNCCGATEYCAMERLPGYALIARNLALVDEDLSQLVAPCSACYLNLRKTDKVMADSPAFGAKIRESLAAGGLSYEPGRVRVRHLLDVLHDDVGEKEIRAAVKRPLTGLKVAPYYGCQIVRPFDDVDHPEYPTKLDDLMAWVGATVVDYPVKTHCCGGHMTQISEEQAFELIRRLLDGAARYNTDVLACLCPMCQVNLDAYQRRVNRRFQMKFDLPVLFFTQLVGLAFGLEHSGLGIGTELVPAKPVLAARLEREGAKGEARA
ncbi:MAG: CoB--CoM heterodisulfide reductase iron-sulfur subunit B family protein [Acidobacteriota bacterium]|nr:CoB--CoM heterodisulfide reductase iron-sulfur subunit B family protein [Acidobacteriota bacterium]